MVTLITVLHVLVSLLLIGIVLLQPGKEAGMGAALAGGSSTTALGGRGAATILTKITGWLAAVFFVSAIILSMSTLRSSVADSIVDQPSATPAEVTPAPVNAATPTETAPTAPVIPAPTQPNTP